MSAKKLYDAIGEIDDDILIDTEQFIYQQSNSGRRASRVPVGPGHGRNDRISRAVTAILAAALAIVFVFGGMITAQAAGADVFGTMARWTEKIFRPGDLPFIDAFPEDGVIEFTNQKASCIPNTLLSMQEDSEVDYVITVSSLEGGGTVYVYLYVDGRNNQEQGSFCEPGQIVLHGTPGRAIIEISASRDMAADVTITRAPRESMK